MISTDPRPPTASRPVSRRARPQFSGYALPPLAVAGMMEDRTLLSTFVVSSTRRQRPRLAPAGDPRLQRATGRTNTIDFTIPGERRPDDRPALPSARRSPSPF